MKISLGALLLVAVAAALLGSPAQAAGSCGMALICQNGHRYPICPFALTDSGDLVTGHLRLTPTHALHVRLVPSGDGYRYIGQGLWVDGIGQDAVLNFGAHRSVACTVEQE